MRKSLNRKRRATSGQALVEYILMVAVTVSLVASLTSSFRRTLTKLWGFYIKEISAACPGCPPDPRYHLP